MTLRNLVNHEKMEDAIYEYELIDIEFYDDCEPSGFAREDIHTVEYDADGIPLGWTRPEIKAREKIIKDFYAKWIAEHPSKAILNKNLNEWIYVKFQSINETSNKAARSYASTIAVFKLTEILENAFVVEEDTSKSNNNQKRYEKMLKMRYKGTKLMVGIQKTTQEHVQYSISVPTTKPGR